MTKADPEYYVSQWSEERGQNILDKPWPWRLAGQNKKMVETSWKGRGAM